MTAYTYNDEGGPAMCNPIFQSFKKVPALAWICFLLL